MNFADLIVGIIVAAVIIGALAYIISGKKKGRKCMGCPDSSNCQKCNKQTLIPGKSTPIFGGAFLLWKINTQKYAVMKTTYQLGMAGIKKYEQAIDFTTFMQ